MSRLRPFLVGALSVALLGAGLQPAAASNGSVTGEQLAKAAYDNSKPPIGSIPDAPCYTSGKLVQPIYGYVGNSGNHFNTARWFIWRAINQMDRYVNVSSGALNQHVRWKCGANGRADIIAVEMNAWDGHWNWDDILSYVQALPNGEGTRTDRVYHIWMDHVPDEAPEDQVNGQGTVENDDRPWPNNSNDVGPSYAWVRSIGETSGLPYAIATKPHELGHAIGAVQCSAPHANCNIGDTNYRHCWDDYDVMCYKDDGPRVQPGPSSDGVQIVCSDTSKNALFDCNNDDYYYPGRPPATHWLASHWNIACSSFLQPRPNCSTDYTPPPVPQNNRYVSRTTSSITVAWDPVSASDLAGYSVWFKKSTAAQYTFFRNVPGTSVEVTGLQTGTSYDVAISAYDVNSNQSAKSEPVTKTTCIPLVLCAT